MKKFTLTTLIALLVNLIVFSQTQKGPRKDHSGGTAGNQASDSRLILLSPANGKLFSGSDASGPVLFRWTAIVPKPTEPVAYRLKVWQLMQGQNAVEAMRTNQPVVTKEVLNSTQVAINNLYTGPCKPPYLCDFVWAVEALNSDINQPYGISDLYSFKYTGEIGTVTGSGGATIDYLENNQSTKSPDKESKEFHSFNLPVEKIIYDADDNIVAMAIKTKNSEINVLIDEVRIIELSKEHIKSLKISNEDYLKALCKYIATGEVNPKLAWPIKCWQVPCNGSCNMGPGCPGKVWRCKWVGFAR